MPIYEYFCQNCNIDYDFIFRCLSEYNKPFVCSKCNLECVKKISKVSMQPDPYHQGIFHPALNTWVSSKTELNRKLKEKNLAIIEKGMFDGMPSNTKEVIEKNNKKYWEKNGQAIEYKIKDNMDKLSAEKGK